MSQVNSTVSGPFDLSHTIKSLGEAKSGFDVFKPLKATGTAFGLPHFAVTKQPTNEVNKFAQRVVITNWDAELLARMIDAGTLDRARITRLLRERELPIDLRFSDHLDDETPEIRDEMRQMVDYGYDRIVYFPIRLQSNIKGAVSFTGMREPVPIEEMAQMSFVAKHALVQLNEVMEHRTADCPLTAREIEIFNLVTEGLTAEEIGRKLGITSHTISYHTTNAINKLGVRNKTQALVVALQNGWLQHRLD
jgi:DNA-binding NarL/FixJ family response regulator